MQTADRKTESRNIEGAAIEALRGTPDLVTLRQLPPVEIA